MLRAIRRRLGLERSRRDPAGVDVHAAQAASGALFDLADLTTKPRSRNEAILRSLSAPTYLGNNTALCRVLGRYKLLADTEDYWVSVHLMLEGFWEMWLTEVIASLIKPGMKAVDAGANLGYYSLLMADLVGPGGSVHAFEPNADMVRRLNNTLLMNGFAGRAVVHEIALGDTARTARLNVPSNGPGGAAVMLDPGFVNGPTIRIERFDALPELADVDFVKIDVEGAELDLWHGMKGVLESGRPLTVVMEFYAYRYADPAAFLGEIVSFGFSLGLIELVGGVADVTVDQLLARPHDEELLLLLRRGA